MSEPTIENPSLSLEACLEGLLFVSAGPVAPGHLAEALGRKVQEIEEGLRSLERMYNKYVGVPANTYGTLNRFHVSMNRLLYSDYDKLSDLAFDNGYFDQMHFIRYFKRFAGNTPGNFVKQNDSILQIGKIS